MGFPFILRGDFGSERVHLRAQGVFAHPKSLDSPPLGQSLAPVAMTQ